MVGAPANVGGLRAALAPLERRFRAGRLDGTPLPAAQRERLSRRARIEELAELLRKVA